MKTCPQCGVDFEPKKLELFGREVFESRTCPPCGIQAAEEFDRQTLETERLELEKRNRERWHRICPPLYRETDPARLPQDALKTCQGWQYGAQGILVVGDTGSGKTRIMFQLIRRLFNEGRAIRVYTATSFRIASNAAAMDGTSEQWLERATQCEVFYFDDLGQMKLTESSEEMLLAVIEGRCANCLPLLASSQYTGDELAAQFLRPQRGQAIVRRLREFCEVVSV